MIILVDMDDVLEQLVEAVVQHVNDLYGTHATSADVTEWNLAAAFPSLTYEQVYSTVDDDVLWDIVQPMPGAAEALKKLIAEGNEIYIVTASLYENLRKKMKDVLFRYFPFLHWNQVIIAHKKQMILGDVLVDDGPHNLQGGNYRKILFDATHNQSFDETSVGAVRVRNWEECYAELQRLRIEIEGIGN